MKRIISFISIFVLLINLFAFPVNVKADGVPVPGYTELKEIQQDIENGDNRTVQDIWHILQPIGSAIGVIMNPIQTIEFIRDIVDPVAQTLPNYPTSGSDTDKANYITNYMLDNVTFDNSNKTYTLNSDSRSLLNQVINNYKNSTGMIYVYSYNIANYAAVFANGELYQAVKSFLENNSKNICFIRNYSSTSCEIYVFEDASLYGAVQNTIVSNIHINSYVYTYSGWTTPKPKKYSYDENNKTFYLNGEGLNAGYDRFCINNYSAPEAANYINCASYGVKVYRLYKTLNDLKLTTVGQAPYYINNSVNTTYNNTSGDYNITNDNSNHATYGDIDTYINDSFNNTGKNPTPTEIEIYIENVPTPSPIPTPTPTPTPTPDNPSGGGGTVSGNTNNGGTASASATANNSGVNVTVNNNHNINLNVPGLSGNGIGSGTVSGNGNGSGGIFDWISDIGGVIGEFIKNVGSLIADVIKGITETITTILADIPNIISVLVEFVYGGLPDELKAIVILGITTVIFVGVIKMMRK